MKKLMSIFLLLTAIPVLAESVGKVLFTANEVLLSRGGAQNKLGRGDSLLAGDTVITAANSSARIKYLNGTLVTVGENSNYKILSYYPKQGEIELTAELKTGKLESETIGRRKKKEELLITFQVRVKQIWFMFVLMVKIRRIPMNCQMEDCLRNNVSGLIMIILESRLEIYNKITPNWGNFIIYFSQEIHLVSQ